MLVSYTVENYRSFANKMILDLRVEGKPQELEKNPYTTKINGEYISKLCLLYGHNGSGKSNLLESLQYVLWNDIKKLFDPYMPTKEKDLSEFKIQFYNTPDKSSNSKKKPKLYTYTLILDNKASKIQEEMFEHGDTVIFKRDENGEIVGGFKDLAITGIGDQVSVFTYMFKDKSDYKDLIKEYYHIFRLLVPSSDFQIKMTNAVSTASRIISDMYKDRKESKKHMGIWLMFKQLIKLADVGIQDIFFENNKSSLSNMELEKDYQEIMKKKTKNKQEKVIIALYEMHMELEKEHFFNDELISQHNDWKAPFDNVESAGTKSYAMHLYNTVQALAEGCISLHDEIQGVQSDLIKFMIFLFKKNSFPDIPKTSQMILSTHDTNLMTTKDILPNHIWFVNKEQGQSELYCASEFDEIDSVIKVESLYKTNKLQAKYESHSYAIPLSFYLEEEGD